MSEQANEESFVEEEAPTTEKPTTIAESLEAAFEQYSESEEAVSEPSVPVEGEQEQSAETSEAQTEELEPIAAPASFTAEQRERFGSLPREHQEFLSSQYKSFQGDYTRKTQELAQRARQVEELEQTIAPYRDELALNGVSVPQTVNHLLAMRKYLQENPREAIPWLASNIGFDLNKLYETETGESTSPEVAQLKHQLTSMQQQQQAYQQQMAQAQQHTRLAELNSEIDYFRNQVDIGKGQPKYPHFDAVQGTMTGLMPLVFQENPNLSTQDALKLAYEKAVRIHPEVSQSYEKQLREQALAAQKKEAAERAKKARLASSSVTGAPGGQSVGAQPASSSIRDLLEFQLNSGQRV